MKILIIDSHVLVRDAMIALLQRMNTSFSTVVADTCIDALRMFEAHQDIDLMLMDLDPVGKCGADAIARLSACAPGVPIVVLSTHDDGDIVAEAMRRGAVGFIPKTHSAELMMGALELIMLRKGVYLPPSVLRKRDTTEVPTLVAGFDRGEKRKVPHGAGITPKQAQVLGLLLEGKSNKAIAQSLGVEPGTIKIHVSALFRALGVASRTQAIVRAQELSMELSE